MSSAYNLRTDSVHPDASKSQHVLLLVRGVVWWWAGTLMITFHMSDR